MVSVGSGGKWCKPPGHRPWRRAQRGRELPFAAVTSRPGRRHSMSFAANGDEFFGTSRQGLVSPFSSPPRGAKSRRESEVLMRGVKLRSSKVGNCCLICSATQRNRQPYSSWSRPLMGHRSVARSTVRQKYPRRALVVAERQGQASALNMLGHALPFTAVPFFWSQHHDIPIKLCWSRGGMGRNRDRRRHHEQRLCASLQKQWPSECYRFDFSRS